MVKLHHKDAPDLIGRAQWVSGVNLAQRLFLGDKIVGLGADRRADIGVTRKAQIAPCLQKGAAIKVILQMRAACELMVQKAGMRGEDHRAARRAQSQAKVDVVVDDGMCLIKTRDGIKHLAPHHHAGAGHAGQLSLAEREAEVARII